VDSRTELRSNCAAIPETKGGRAAKNSYFASVVFLSLLFLPFFSFLVVVFLSSSRPKETLARPVRRDLTNVRHRYHSEAHMNRVLRWY
jgi:hypothetical protein